MNSNHTNFYSGTSGLVLPVPKSQYPPVFQDKSRLTYFAFLFNSVEINSSFYKLPKVSTITKWAESVPGNFQFTFKLSKTITHAKALHFNEGDVELFMQTVNIVGNKKGCLLIQFPPSLKVEKFDELKNLLTTIKQADSNNSWKVAIEFRNTSWYNDEVYHLLDEYSASLVIHDLPASATPLTAPATSFKYLRFHGPEPRYRGSYDATFLHQYAKYIKAWLREGKTVYAYFNNTMGDAVQNLQALNSLIKQ